MAEELTTSENALGGVKTEETPEMTKELKEAQKAADKEIIESYGVQIDQLELEIPKLEKAIEMNLPEREVKAQIRQLKEQCEKFKKMKTLVEGRNQK